jgi:hypothetical protein
MQTSATTHTCMHAQCCYEDSLAKGNAQGFSVLYRSGERKANAVLAARVPREVTLIDAGGKGPLSCAVRWKRGPE